MTNYMFGLLEKAGVPTHLVKELNDRETLVKKVSIVPLEVIVRNVAAGSFSKKLGIEEGTKLLCPTLEFSYKNDDLAILSSTTTMRLHSVLQQRKKSTLSQSTLSR